MKILVLGGTRFFGIPMIRELLKQGHEITVATRGTTPDSFGTSVTRMILDRHDEASIVSALHESTLHEKTYDVVIDKLAYCSNDVRILLNYLSCDKFILMSSAAVYEPMGENVPETDFDASMHSLKWCNRSDYEYGEVKRQAECALTQIYKNKPYIAVRYPVVMGKNDYTNRLKFYVDHIINEIPMYIDDMDARISFIEEEDAGRFLAFLVDKPIIGPINGCASGSVRISDLVKYIEKKSMKKALLSNTGDIAPYNGYHPSLTLNTDKAKELGYEFSDINDWIYSLLDYYML